MNKNRYWFYFLGLLLFLGFFTNSVFAEVVSLQTDNNLIYKGDQVHFLGTVESGSTGLVTIVIRDHNDEFVVLTQAIIDHDNSFEEKMVVKEQFIEHEEYTAIAFILNMTQGSTTNFKVTSNEFLISKDLKTDEKMNLIIQNEQVGLFNKSTESIKAIEPVLNNIESSFVDPNKDSYHYVERYYSEPIYKSWFDRNYPGQTIEKYVGYEGNINKIESPVQEIISSEIIPQVQASSLLVELDPNQVNNSDIAEISLSIAALGILFGAVYGIKRQVDSNSKQISLNKDMLRKRILHPFLGPDPKKIIQTRLAKGEITLDEYEKLKTKLN